MLLCLMGRGGTPFSPGRGGTPPSRPGRGVPPPLTIQTWPGGYPDTLHHPDLARGDIPLPSIPGQGYPGVPPVQTTDGVHPIQTWNGVPLHLDLIWGTPSHQDLWWGTPLSRPGMGYPPPQSRPRMGYPFSICGQTYRLVSKHNLPSYFVRGR